MKLFFLTLFILLQISLTQHTTPEEVLEAVNEKVITYGSTLRIQNVLSKF